MLYFLSGDRARRSPRKLPTALKEEKKRWVMPKFLPHKYDVKLISEDKVCTLSSAVNKCLDAFSNSLQLMTIISGKIIFWWLFILDERDFNPFTPALGDQWCPCRHSLQNGAPSNKGDHALLHQALCAETGHGRECPLGGRGWTGEKV